ncbi:MAG: hypothetical protein K0Q66_857 [Chitinophagaceae bacterium]|jgi:hypothetical protein|nr:hypothetical protein [Chitinophagaceae bacterium]
MKRFFLLLILVNALNAANAQELEAKVTVNAQRVYNTVDKKIFTSLQTQLTNLLNNRKWTNDVFQPNEKIKCNFLLNIDKVLETNVYQASLTIQSARPVFNATYEAAMVNYMDADVSFRYVEFQPVEFNENRIQGTDPLAANLTAVFGYYVYMILGMDYNSFSPKGGDAYFQKALNIVNNAPENRAISGWKAFDGLRNRYWLAENLTNTRYNVVHDVMYTYYRQGLDNMYDNEADGRRSVLNALKQLKSFNEQNQNTMILQFFLQGKSLELIRMFKKAPQQERSDASAILSQLDITNASKYKDELK